MNDERCPLRPLAKRLLEQRGAELTAYESQPQFIIRGATVRHRLSARLRVTGTLNDSAYTAKDGQLASTHTFRAPRNTILLPAGWHVTSVSAPATVSAQADGESPSRSITPG